MTIISSLTFLYLLSIFWSVSKSKYGLAISFSLLLKVLFWLCAIGLLPTTTEAEDVIVGALFTDTVLFLAAIMSAIIIFFKKRNIKVDKSDYGSRI